jgi:4-amino-4-deoxy-L-arabinose transferase-like glycosyltransferase
MPCRDEFNQIGTDKTPFWHNTGAILICIVLLGGALRFYNLKQSPPGLNQDEAANAWNAYCLLKTGKDQVGVSWPIFYIHGLGGNASTLYLYALLPFQAIGGLNIITTRLPGAVGGVITILLVYLVGKRLFNKETGLIAALLLALNPWHLQQSRWGHEASIGALLGIAPLAAMLWANMPFSDNKDASPRVLPAAIAGIVTGICCYGYHSVRLYLPIALAAAGLVTLPSWWRQLKSRRGALAICLYILGFAATFGPLAWQHIFHPEGISRHSQFQKSLFIAGSIPLTIKNVASRYIQHFGPDFLFIHGDPYQIQSPPNAGQFHWYMLPLMVLGFIFVIRRFRSSYSARVLLALVLTYPIGDCFFEGIGMHALRSSPGLCGLILLGSFGFVHGIQWLSKQNRILTKAAIVLFAALVIGLNVRYLHHFYHDYNYQQEIYHGYHCDLVEACEWLRPRFDKDEISGVFCSTKGMGMAYIITLVCLQYEPERWFREERVFNTIDEFDYCIGYGKLHFIYGSSAPIILENLRDFGFKDNVIFIVRPNELDLKNPIHKIRRPDGQETLWIFQVEVPSRPVMN